MPGWHHCYACGSALTAKKTAAAGQPVKRIASFEDGNPFGGGTVTDKHATHGSKALRIDRGYVSMDAAQNWSGYDYLKADVYTDATKPAANCMSRCGIGKRAITGPASITRRSFRRAPARSSFPPPSMSARSRGRAAPCCWTASRGWSSPSATSRRRPSFLDNIRLERDTETAKVKFDGLWAFDVGPAGSPVMEGFTPLDVSKTLHQGPRLRLEERPLLARLRRPAARSALPRFHLCREGRPGHRRAQRQVSRLRQHGFALGFLGRVPALSPACR